MLYVAAPVYLSDITNAIYRSISGGPCTGDMVSDISMALILALSGFVLAFIGNVLIGKGSVDLAHDLTDRIFLKLGRVPYSFFVRRKEGDISSRITNDC